ncbi:hypothetical protein FEM48_Zijuj12G0024300 [Ziziphus jujuba var. spinosa]|uniref:Kinesin-like protein KIN-14L n=1 Tax=Ziziphus jujuba var. spinosa TaxID=714518 RepID=A0A978UAN9_ZIZJJ|nr:hypothetical protein FEM48_Zijuj12G0024300 [Ziziphus jujuba var. spinosa]
MENSVRGGTHDFTMASRKAEETAWRRYQAIQWLESLLGPLRISNQPSEREFISFLRNGLVLCNAINKIHPGAVPKVVENPSHLQSLTWENQPLPAYQYFENVRNFLVAVEDLKIPAFEASDLERDTLEAGSGAKVVDCILALKSYHEGKQISNGNGFYKFAKSPLVMHSANRMHSRPSSDSCKRLDMSVSCERQPPLEGENQKLEEHFVESMVKLIAERIVDAKENINGNLLASFRNGDLLQSVLKDCLKGRSVVTSPQSTLEPLEDLSALQNTKRCKACLRKGNCQCHHNELFKTQEKELLDLKVLLMETKKEFEGLQSQLQRDLKDLGTQVQELSTAALSYHRVAQENRNLYNMVQDLKGNIRVYCRIRPSFVAEAINVIDFVGEDGSLVLLDPSKPHKDGRKVFNFNRVFGPTATQDEVFKDTQPLIRSVMDGYNVCIFAYGQTGSGKTHTMSGPSCGTTKDMGINYLALNDLFQISNGRKDIITYDIHVQMVEIYNEQVRDLLAEDSSIVKLEIRSCTSDSGLSLPDATMRSVKSTTDVLNIMKLGEVNRVVSSTAVNNRSSRSHSVLTVHVHGKDASGGKLRSCLHLVDLAGSERVDKSEVTGERLKEAQYINKSLSCLGDVITALAQKNSHIPYRNSKLTLLLQDSLGGHAKTLMFAHVSPEEDSFGETVSTLKFAQRVSTVELGASHSNKESSEVMRLKEQIESLKKALANKEAQSVQFNKTCEKPRALIERTPPRPRRLSIENCGTTKNVKPMNLEDKKGSKTPTFPNRSRRLSLEGPRSVKKDNSHQINVSDDVAKSFGNLDNGIYMLAKAPRSPTSASYQRRIIKTDAEAVIKPFGNLDNGSSMLAKDPRSPTSATYQKRVTKTESRTRIPSLQLPKTPEPQIRGKNEVHMHNELTLSIDNLTPYAINSTNGKGSHIRRSLRTIGKLINGSEKRNQQSLMDAQSNIKGASNANDVKSPVTTSARSLRRQSLTGIQTSDRSRRSSLGGKPDENISTKDTRNATTPPPMHTSTKLTKRWL